MSRKIYALSDWHLPPNIMDQYGPEWVNHIDKIQKNIAKKLTPNDILLAPGDIINVNNPEVAESSFKFIERLPCKIIICQGNHDVWSDRKLEDFEDYLPKNMIFLRGNSITIDNLVISGAMFWCFNCAFPWEGHVGIMKRLTKHQNEELASFKSALSEFEKYDDSYKKILLLHFPPISDKGEPNIFTTMIEGAKVDVCIYGHVHGQKEFVPGCETTIGNTKYMLVSADYRNFDPIEIQI